MKVHVANHPLISHKLTVLRDERTDSPTFRLLVSELVTLLAYEATRDVRTKTIAIKTPVTSTTGQVMAEPQPVVVPILRAGLGMLDGMTKLLPTAQVGFLGMVRDEETLQASTYANRLPDDLSGRQVFVLDPMLATGSSIVMTYKALLERGIPRHTHIVSALASAQGVDYVKRHLSFSVTLWCGAIDEELTAQAYIVPGLGDAGDLAYGAKL